MKKTLVTGILAAALIVGGGTGIMVAAAKENPDNSAKVNQEQGMNKMMESGNMGDMQKMMKSGNKEDMQKMMGNQSMISKEMKKQMKEMHPELSDKKLKEHHNSMTRH
ncbi:hypothetical protein [Neobacillus drentensis]|uniref:hypothetical protein n=1 Tax=Neobacillus drentensis TaxID=220684 RepID=UPI002FFE2ECC